MSKRLLDVSPTGVQHYVEVEDDGDTLVTIEHTPTVIEDEILDSCAVARSLHQKKGAAFQFAARIPVNTHQQWKREFVRDGYVKTMTWAEFEVMKLNNRDNCNLRTGYKRSGSKKL